MLDACTVKSAEDIHTWDHEHYRNTPIQIYLKF